MLQVSVLGISNGFPKELFQLPGRGPVYYYVARPRRGILAPAWDEPDQYRCRLWRVAFSSSYFCIHAGMLHRDKRVVNNVLTRPLTWNRISSCQSP